jgi:hypothetical protein
LCPECNNEYKASVSHRTSGTGCPKCGAKKSAANRRRKVCKINMVTNEIIKIYESVTDAAIDMNFNNSSNITSVCKNKRPHAGGYLWRYADEMSNIDIIQESGKKEKYVLQELWEDIS